jgi:diacylglycerol kinase family enzyme
VSSPKPATLADRPGGRSPGALRGKLMVRLAALLALFAVAILLLIVGSVLMSGLADVVVAFVLFVIVACSGWVVLTRRGLRRLLGLAAFVLALAAFVLQLGPGGFLLIALLTAVVAVFGVSARYAVRRDRTASDTTASARRTQAAEKGVLIINPHSGGGKAQRFNLAEEAEKRSVQPVLLEPQDNLRELAERTARGGADVIGMAGGDGSQAVVAAVAAEHDVAHVCVPAGTRNHFAVDLGLDRDDVVGALDAFTDGVERRIDLARVNGRVFVNNASLGVYARVVQSDAYREAKLGTWRQMLPDMLGQGAAPIDLQFEGPDASGWCRATLVLVSNNPYELRRFGGVGTRPRLDSGRLGILAARVESARTIARLLAFGRIGQRRFRDVVEWSSSEFEVRSRGSVEIGLDGEACLLVPPLQFVSLPGALRVRMPQHASGVSPAGAAVALSRRDLARLVRVAVGRKRRRERLAEGASK